MKKVSSIVCQMTSKPSVIFTVLNVIYVLIKMHIIFRMEYDGIKYAYAI